MTKYSVYENSLRNDLKKVSSNEKAHASRRYFPDGVNCVGATAQDIKAIAMNFHAQYSELTADEVLGIVEHCLKHVEYHEEVLVAFALINKFVKNNYDDHLLNRFEYWLEHYVTNWAQVDDLCIKTIYQFFMARPHLIDKTQHWANSNVSWCRRASNVVWVKFIKRKIGRSTYYLNNKRIFNNCDLLLEDDDAFVQKSVGWLLKVTSVHYEQEVIDYIANNFNRMHRTTIQYAIEKMDSQTRSQVLALTK